MLELNLVLAFDLALLQSAAALSAHDDVDIKSANKHIENLYLNALGRIPYITKGKSATEIKQDEINQLIEEYKQWKQEQLKILHKS